MDGDDVVLFSDIDEYFDDVNGVCVCVNNQQTTFLFHK